VVAATCCTTIVGMTTITITMTTMTTVTTSVTTATVTTIAGRCFAVKTKERASGPLPCSPGPYRPQVHSYGCYGI